MGNNKNKRLNVSTLQFLILSLAVSLVSVPLVYATCVGIRQRNLEAEAETDVFTTMNFKSLSLILRRHPKKEVSRR